MGVAGMMKYDEWLSSTLINYGSFPHSLRFSSAGAALVVEPVVEAPDLAMAGKPVEAMPSEFTGIQKNMVMGQNPKNAGDLLGGSSHES